MEVSIEIASAKVDFPVAGGPTIRIRTMTDPATARRERVPEYVRGVATTFEREHAEPDRKNKNDHRSGRSNNTKP